MINVVKLKWHKLRRQRSVFYMATGLLALLSWQLMNELLLRLLGLSNQATPWSVFEVLRDGWVTPSFIAVVVTVIPVLAGVLCLQGGVKRAISVPLLLYWVAFILLSSLGLYVFTLWEGLVIAPYPWLIYALFLQLPSGSASINHLMVCLMVSYSLLFIAILLKCFSAKTKAEKVFGNAHFASAFEMQRMGLFSEEGIVIGKAHGKRLKMPGFESALVVAPTGSGKTTAIAIPNLLDWDGSVVVNDLKGELYQLTALYRKHALNNACFLWAPADPDKNTACYNPFFYVSKNPELRIRDLQLIAEILIPATKMGDGFWYQSSREVFLTLALYLFETSAEITLAAIHDLSKQDNFVAWLENEITKQDFSKTLTQNAFAFLDADPKTQRNILKDFHSRMGLFNDPIVNHATHKNDFDYRCLRKEKMSIYIQIPDADKERLSPILTLFWAQLIHVMTTQTPKNDEPYGVLALLDEFGNMARINQLKDGLSFLRSYHVRCVVIVQYLSQITSVYGRDDAKGFLNCKVKIAFALNDIDDAAFFSKALGNKTVKVRSSSVSTAHGERGGSRSENQSFQSRVLMNVAEIMRLSNKKSIILIEAQSPIKANKCFWFNESDLNAKLQMPLSEQHDP